MPLQAINNWILDFDRFVEFDFCIFDSGAEQSIEVGRKVIVINIGHLSKWLIGQSKWLDEATSFMSDFKNTSSPWLRLI